MHGGPFRPVRRSRPAEPTYDRGMRVTRWGAGALAALLLVATGGCGEQAADAPARDTAASASDLPAQADADGDRVPPLPALSG